MYRELYPATTGIIKDIYRGLSLYPAYRIVDLFEVTSDKSIARNPQPVTRNPQPATRNP